MVLWAVLVQIVEPTTPPLAQCELYTGSSPSSMVRPPGCPTVACTSGISVQQGALPGLKKNTPQIGHVVRALQPVDGAAAPDGICGMNASAAPPKAATSAPIGRRDRLFRARAAEIKRSWASERLKTASRATLFRRSLSVW